LVLAALLLAGGVRNGDVAINFIGFAMAFIYVGALEVDFRRSASFRSPDYIRHNL